MAGCVWDDGNVVDYWRRQLAIYDETYANPKATGSVTLLKIAADTMTQTQETLLATIDMLKMLCEN